MKRVLLLPALLCGAAAAAFAGECSQPLNFYDQNHYFVTDIRVQSTLGFIKSALTQVDTSALRLHKRKKNENGQITDPGLFNMVALSLDTRTVKQQLERIGDRLDITIAVPAVENCDDTAHSLAVVFRVYRLNFPAEETGVSTLASTVVRSLAPANGLGSLTKTAFPHLVLGYDRTHRLFGGTDTVMKTGSGGIFDTMRLRSVGSGSTASTEAAFSGTRDYSSSKIAHAEWAVGYAYGDEPTGVLQIKQSKLFGRASIATAATQSGITFHFGSALEGGNEQTNAVSNADGLARSPYGALKLYGAVDARWRGNPLSISYGAQLGKATSGLSVDYTKHLVDVVQSVELFPAKDRHKSVSLEGRFTAGFSTGTLPLAERYLGGNRETYFIAGESWRILDQPLIRSFAANRLTLPGAGIYGGDGFYSVNTTVSYPLYHRPLVPAEVLKDPTLNDMVAGALSASTKVLENHYITLAPDFIALREDLLALADPLRALRQTLMQLNTAGIPADKTKDALADLDSLDSDFTKAQDPTLADPSAPVVTAAVGFPSRFVDADLVTLADDLQTAIDALPAGMATQRADLVQQQTRFRSAVTDPESGFAVRFPKINMELPQQKAKNDMKLPSSVLHRFLNELNLISISPVLMADAAQIRSRLVTNNPGWRYGVGPGIRFSLVNVNFTVGYSFNAGKKEGEGVGAFYAGITFGDLFR